MENNNVGSANINAEWLKNIAENLKNLEILERLSYEGCSSLLDYVQMPYEQRNIVIADTMYKNLCFMVTEIGLLLTDLTPVIDKEKIEKFEKDLYQIRLVINNRRLFIQESHSATQNAIISSKVKPFFIETRDYLSLLRKEIIYEIRHILYIRSDKKNEQFGVNLW